MCTPTFHYFNEIAYITHPIQKTDKLGKSTLEKCSSVCGKLYFRIHLNIKIYFIFKTLFQEKKFEAFKRICLIIYRRFQKPISYRRQSQAASNICNEKSSPLVAVRSTHSSVYKSGGIKPNVSFPRQPCDKDGHWNSCAVF